MLFDFTQAWSRLTEKTYDVCVCGTGPAGVTVARKLATAGNRVALIEGGGLEYTEESQNLYKGASVGRQYWNNVQDYRLRYFGGTSNHWTGRCGVFDPIDFEPRKYFGSLGGWPISRQEVMDFTGEAKDILDIPNAQLEPSSAKVINIEGFDLSGFALSPPTRFASKYLDELQSSEQIDCFYNANLIGASLDEPRKRAMTFDLASFGGQRAKVRANQYVLALGAIENCRFLLTTAQASYPGMGNGGGMVGRCFMEHLNVPIGRFVVVSPDHWKQAIDLCPTASVMEEKQIGNGIIDYGPNASPTSYGRLRVVKQFLRETGCSVPGLRDLMARAIDYDCPGDGVITSLLEQRPNPTSRIVLGREVDVFGMARVELRWTLDEQDLRTIRTLSMLSAMEMAKSDLARVQLAPYILNADADIVVDGHAHQMGTTRMSNDPSKGVVDPNCKIHGMANVYVAGSSVFPTGGGTNPTLTIVALALRLASHLASTGVQ